MVLVASDPPMAGKLWGIIFRATQACLLRNILSVEVVKYTIRHVSSLALDGEVPEIRRARAQMMPMALWFTADLFMLTGEVEGQVSSVESHFGQERCASHCARHDWHPVSASAMLSLDR